MRWMDEVFADIFEVAMRPNPMIACDEGDTVMVRRNKWVVYE